MVKNMKVAIGGMHCAACSARIERVVAKMEGVDKASVNLATEQGEFVYNPALIQEAEIAERIHKLGFTAKDIVEDSGEKISVDDDKLKELEVAKKRLIFELVLVVPLLVISMGEMMGISLPAFLAPHTSPLTFALVQFSLAALIMFLGRNFYTVGIPALLRKAPNMDSLIAMGTGAAFVYSCWNTVEILFGVDPQMKAMDLYFESAGVLVALVSLGKYLELRSKRKSSDAIRLLMEQAPKEAVVLHGDEQKVIPAADIKPGDVLLIRPGASIPADGIIQSGEPVLDESLLTGESMPVNKAVGDAVYGGTVNSHTPFTMTAEQTGDATLLAGIVRLVVEAQSSKPSIARIADKVSYYFVPAVMAFALLTGICWYAFGDVGFSGALRFFIAVMVIACPCAMGLATPISVMVGTGRGAQLGILVKNGATLELLEKTDVLLFDKTGTVTEGRPEVVAIDGVGDYSPREIAAFAGSLEQYSEHPLAAAVTRYCEKEGIAFSAAEMVENSTGRGVLGDVAGTRVVTGNRAFCKEHVDSGEISAVEEEHPGKTVLYVGIDKKFAGSIIIADRIKPQAVDVIKKLKKCAITPVMVTGDAQATARTVADELGIQQVVAEVLPDQKAALVMEKQGEGCIVTMVGDGMNDAPALAQADIGIAMGTGIDIAMESGDAVIMKGNLSGVLAAIELSRSVMKNIRQNLFWAFGYNIIGIPVAAGILYIFGGPQLNPMIAGAAMAMSSVSVVSNALRLRFFTPTF